MKDYKLKASKSTPQIDGSVENGQIIIKGKCQPENSVDFFRPLINWANYFKLLVQDIHVRIELEGLNTSSGMMLFRFLSSMKNDNQRLVVCWVHDVDDTDMKQVGEDFRYMLGDVVVLEVKQKA